MTTENPWLYWATLYTDGSYAHGQGGSYAFRVRHNLPPIRIEESGQLPDCKDANLAEATAILRGVERILSTYERVDGIGVNTDSQTAISLLKFKARPHRRDDFRAVQRAFRALLDRKEQEQGFPVKIRMKWVKGHQNSRDTRAWLNNRCDELAGKQRK